MRRSRIHILSYLAAFLIGAILFEAVWRSISGYASSAVVLSGVAGVTVAVILFLLWNEFKKPKDDNH